MKQILLLLSSVLLLGCSKDDDAGNENQKQNKFVDRITLVSNGNTHEIIFTYNQDRQISSYKRGNTNLTYEYNNGKLARIKDTDLVNTPYQFLYNGNVLSNFQHYDNSYPVTFNPTDNSYNLQGGDLKIGITGSDIAYVSQYNDREIHSFTYSNANKGPLYNLDTHDGYLIPLLTESSYFFLTTMPITQVTVNPDGTQVTYTAEHIFDSEGYVTSTVLRSGSNEFIRAQFHYVEL